MTRKVLSGKKTPQQGMHPEYENRINRVIDYVNHHLDKKLSLQKLAGIACFSQYHFHRIFSVMTGETLNDFIRRIRLERSANMLMQQNHIPMTEIALGNGFTSSAIFSRAFRDHFQMSPTAFRDNFCNHSKICKPKSNKSKARRSHNHYTMPVITPAEKMRFEKTKVKITRLPDYPVAYVRYIGAYGNEIMGAWQKLARWAGSQPLGDDAQWMGIVYDNPGITPQTRCRYDACVTLPTDQTAIVFGKGIGKNRLSGGLYALYTVQIAPEKIGSVYHYLYGHWLLQSGYEPDNLPGIQKITMDSDKKDDWVVTIGIPVKPI